MSYAYILIRIRSILSPRSTRLLSIGTVCASTSRWWVRVYLSMNLHSCEWICCCRRVWSDCDRIYYYRSDWSDCGGYISLHVSLVI